MYPQVQDHCACSGSCSSEGDEKRVPLRRALISVYKKDSIVEVARALADTGTEIISTGSTAKTLIDAGIPVTPVEQVTGFPECLDGRVKTLHPKIHAGILANRELDSHVQQLAELEVTPIDLVICNLYPFEEAVEREGTYQECVELIDIGGPSMVRAAAKNHASVAVVVDPEDYETVIEAAEVGGFSLAERQYLAAQAFSITAEYDAAIADWMMDKCDWDNLEFRDDEEESDEDELLELPLEYEELPPLEYAETLRYGENPHQQGALFVDYGDCGIAHAELLGGKQMSFNNYVDGDAAWRAANDFATPAVAIMKHANPCGIATDPDIAQAHRKAHACDPLSAFGGVIAVNRTVTLALAQSVKPIFTEVIIAPDYDEDALELLRTKKNLRILRAEPPLPGERQWKLISGGAVVQDVDEFQAEGDDPANWTLVAGKAADEATLADLKFAWTACRSVKSNAILIARDGASVGVGMGQVNRFDSAKLAVERANTLGEAAEGADKPCRTAGAVAASDAFFPFPDGLQVLINAGITAVVQPGGSIRDEEVIEAAKAAGITMYFTGSRHFFH